MPATRSKSCQDAKESKTSTTTFLDRSPSLRSSTTRRAKRQKKVKSATALQPSSTRQNVQKIAISESASKQSALATTITTGVDHEIAKWLPASKQSTHTFNSILVNCLQHAAGITPLHTVTICQDPLSSIFHEVASLSKKAVAGTDFHDDLQAFMVEHDIYGSIAQEQLLVNFIGQAFCSLLGRGALVEHSLEAGTILDCIVQEQYNFGLPPLFDAILLWYAVGLGYHLTGYMRRDERTSKACDATIIALNASRNIHKVTAQLVAESLDALR